jgi:hypothetical protein
MVYPTVEPLPGFCKPFLSSFTGAHPPFAGNLAGYARLQELLSGRAR